MSNLQELMERHKPLRERVFDLIKDETTFTLKDVKRLFPNEVEKALYRVVKELEVQKRIRFLAYQDRSKLYTAIGNSELPMLVGVDGASFPCSEVLKNIEAFYGPNGYWTRLEAINQLPIVISKLFIIAQSDDKRALKDGWVTLQQELLAVKSQTQAILGYCDSILKHPSMNGDLEKFKAVFAGEDEALPTPQELTAFKLWFKKWSELNAG